MFTDEVDVLEICDGQSDGQSGRRVDLLRVGLLKKLSASCGIYEFEQTPSSSDLAGLIDAMESITKENTTYSKLIQFDPPFRLHDISFASINVVPCVRCLVWPSQAAEWVTRSRPSGWPDSSTIDSIIGNGCDLILINKTRLPEPNSTVTQTKLVWELSFSKAELILLNDWSPMQQVLYHVAKFFLESAATASKSNDTNICFQSISRYARVMML